MRRRRAKTITLKPHLNSLSAIRTEDEKNTNDGTEDQGTEEVAPETQLAVHSANADQQANPNVYQHRMHDVLSR